MTNPVGREIGLTGKKAVHLPRQHNTFQHLTNTVRDMKLDRPISFTSFRPIMLQCATPNVTMQQRGALFPQFSLKSNSLVAAVFHTVSLSAPSCLWKEQKNIDKS